MFEFIAGVVVCALALAAWDRWGQKRKLKRWEYHEAYFNICVDGCGIKEER